ncbi:Argonaute complex, subunit Arb1 [Echria macrotheca]|uniref:Argonaute complex, subunit Arb1 n=1 Tax=Echria macrotheca TaxID=438768 RepID=A0AAJ0B5V4_9PEZI|nr:Argonaute complex, subunit Arb1 [Echria macrotheca]
MSSAPDTDLPGPVTAVADTHNQEHHQRVEYNVTQMEGIHTRKKKKKNKSGKGKKRATGFEEYYCDPPMTPAEFEEEREVQYPLHRPFVNRIEDAIRRYRASRRLDNERSKAFTRYLLLGGVDATARQFTGISGLDDEFMEERTKTDVRDMAADDVIARGEAGKWDARFYNPDYPEHWDVDFAGVAAGFFSESLLAVSCSDMRSYRVGVEVVSNFLNYLDRHDVCPEYIDDIRKARQICEVAPDEMTAIMDVCEHLPGLYNTAASMLFPQEIEDEMLGSYSPPSAEDLDKDQARTVFGVNLALLLDPEHGQRVGAKAAEQKLGVIETTKQAFEIVNISLADEKARARYGKINKYLARDKFKVERCGYLTVRPTVVQDRYDVPAGMAAPAKVGDDSLVFFLEEKLLKRLKVGMILELVVATMNEGVRFIRHVLNVYPTFHTFLPQELMLRYKAPVDSNRGRHVVDDGGDDDEHNTPKDIVSDHPETDED